MAVFTIEIDDKLVQEVGVKAVNDFLQNQADYLRLQFLGDKIKTAIEEAGIDHNKLVTEAREAAWKKYKETVLKGRI